MPLNQISYCKLHIKKMSCNEQFKILTSSKPISNKHSIAPIAGRINLETVAFCKRKRLYFGFDGYRSTLSTTFNKTDVTSKNISLGFSSRLSIHFSDISTKVMFKTTTTQLHYLSTATNHRITLIIKLFDLSQDKKINKLRHI